jgi:hypothetical protein
MDSGSALGVATIPPFVAIFFEVVNPISGKFLEASISKDLNQFRGELSDSYYDLEKIVHKMIKAGLEFAMLALTVVSVITSGFAIIQQFERPFVPAITYVTFFILVTLMLWRLLAGYTLLEFEEVALGRIGRYRYYSRSAVIKMSIYLLNGLLILFAFAVLEIPFLIN